jgi:hypothetical protein
MMAITSQTTWTDLPQSNWQNDGGRSSTLASSYESSLAEPSHAQIPASENTSIKETLSSKADPQKVGFFTKALNYARPLSSRARTIASSAVSPRDTTLSVLSTATNLPSDISLRYFSISLSVLRITLTSSSLSRRPI